MHYKVAEALTIADSADLMPIRAELLHDNGFYRLRAANGKTKTVTIADARNAWANAGWPERANGRSPG